MNFRELIYESPFNGMNMDMLKRAKEFSKNVKTFINDIKPSKKLFNDYMYAIKGNVFVIFKKDTPVFYIVYKVSKNIMYIQNVENISSIKGLSFKIYSAILNLKLFEKIYTGNVLSTKNIKAHKKYILNGFKMYISDTNELITKDNFDEIIKKSDYNTEFVLTNSNINEALLETYNLSFLGKNTNIDDIIEQSKEMLNYYKSIKRNQS